MLTSGAVVDRLRALVLPLRAGWAALRKGTHVGLAPPPRGAEQLGIKFGLERQA